MDMSELLATVSTMSDDNASTLGRRQVLRATGAGVVAVAVPACTVQQFPYVPTYDGDGGAFIPPGGDAGSMTGHDSGTSQPTDSGSGQQADTSGNPPEDSSAPQDSGSPVDSATAMDTATGTCTNGANTLMVALSMYPELGSSGGSVALNDSRYSDPKCGGNDFYVVATGGGQFAAFSASCTHACCTIQISGSSARCPCHGATFDVATGKHTGGPGSNLPALPGVCSDGTNLFIQLA